MKNVLLILSLLIVCSSAIKAQKGNFGLGIILGEPTGISAKFWTGQTTAFDGAAAWSLSNNNGGALHLHANFLKHNFNLLKVEKGQLPIYYGVGAKIVMADDIIFGIRVPLGISYIFDDRMLPLDIFLEIVPVIGLIPSTGFDFDGALGVRYYF